MQLSDKYGLSAAVARKRAGLPPLGPVRPGTMSGASSLGPISMTDDSGKDLVTNFLLDSLVSLDITCAIVDQL